MFGFVAVLALCFGITLSVKPAQTVQAAQTMSPDGWTVVLETGNNSIRIQNGTTYWTTGEGTYVTPDGIMNYTEINGKTLAQINAEMPGAINVTLQAPGGEIGSFFRVNVNAEYTDFTVKDIVTLVVREGWSHTDSSGTYTIDTDLYFACTQKGENWMFVTDVVDVSDKLVVSDQGELNANARTILVATSGTTYWTSNPRTPNEGNGTKGGPALNTIYINGTSIKEWNTKAYKMLENGEISDITFGAQQDNIKNGAPYAPIVVLNGTASGLGSIFQTWVPTGYINGISSFKIGKGFGNLQGTTLYYVSKDVEYVRSGSAFVRVASTVDITDDLKIRDVQSINDGTTLYYIGGKDNTQKWTKIYGQNSIAINEHEWKGVTDSSKQGGAVQMSYLAVNGTSIYDINVSDNGAYGATQGNIASGGKYAPILAFVTATEIGGAIKLQIPNAYPSGSGVAGDNHKTLAVLKGFYVLDSETNIKYEVTKDVQWDYVDGQWVDHVNLIKTTVTDARLFGSSSDAFAGVQLADSDYKKAPGTYSGVVKTAKSYAQSANFLSHVLIDDKPLAKPGEAFLNVWGNYGYFTFRPGNNSATKITILAGCQFPTYMALLTGAKEAYVTTEDVTFIKDASGNWVKDEGAKVYTVNFVVDGATYDTQEITAKECATMPTAPTKAESDRYTYTFSGWYLNGANFDFATQITENITLTAVFQQHLKEGEYDTSISRVTYARDNKNNWMMFRLSDKDYPNAGENYNISVDEDKIAALNLYDKIIVDGYTIRSRIATHGNPTDTSKINLWVDDCFAFRIPGATGTLDGAKKVVIRAGAQFPSYEYAKYGTAAYFVTTEEIIFEYVGADNGRWERRYTATFVADGEVVDTISYLPSQGLTAPAVPEKEGQRGVWEAYTANGNITVNAVYTEINFEYADTDVSTFKWDGDNNSYVTFYLTNGENVAQMYGNNTSIKLNIYNLWDNIIVTTKNGNVLTLGDVYAGDGGDSWYISFGNTPSLLVKLATAYKRDGADAIVGVFVPKGTEFPSFDKYGEKAYVTTTSATYEYNGDNVWAYVFTESSIKIPAGFGDNYVLSDLYKIGYEKSYNFADGIETLNNTEGLSEKEAEANYRYGYVDGTAFTLTFDMSFTSATYYETFNINLGTEGYGGNKYHFGWRFYLVRGNDEAGIVPNICVEYFSNTSSHGGNIPGSANTVLGNSAFVANEIYHITIGYRLVNATTGEVEVYTAVNQYSRIDTYVLGGTFVNFASYAKTLTMNLATPSSNGTVTVSDPFKDRDTSNKLIIDLGNNQKQEVNADSFVLPEVDPVENNQIGKVFVGWTTDKENLSTLYPAGYELEINGNIELYPVYVGFVMQDGASVRKANGEGIRFTVLVDGVSYDALGDKILETGVILAPTSYLANRELTHELGVGYYVERPTEKWAVGTGDTRKFAAAFLNISADQYSRKFSARGYLMIQYAGGVGYVYTDYSEENHSRSIYQVATMAKNANEESEVLDAYVDAVADLLVNAELEVSKNSNVSDEYSVSKVDINGNVVTVTLSGSVKTVVLNGERLVMGYNAKVLVGGIVYEVSAFKLSTNGSTITFELTKKEETLSKDQYVNRLNSYLARKDYSDIHYNHVKALVEEAVDAINASNSANVWVETYEKAISTIERVKNAVQHEANKGEETLSAPVLAKGLGYTVTWNAVANADYYIVYDDNDYRDRVVVMANDEESLVYEAEVIGNHNVYVIAHSYYEEYNTSKPSTTIATPEVKPVFSYKAMQDGLYKFDSTQMSTMGISSLKDLCYFDNSAKEYFVYYNKNTGWSPYETARTDWSSPEEFPAHAQRLKDMGNNVIMVNRDSVGEYKADDTWASSRLKYIMDTAWSMGMKVLVCDEVFYTLSISESGAEGAATSKKQVSDAIGVRQGFADYVTHPAFYGFSLDDEPHSSYLSGALTYTIQALREESVKLGVEPFFLSCLYQADGGGVSGTLKSYYETWFNIDGSGIDYIDYLYVDIYTKHAMGQPTDRYNKSFSTIYEDFVEPYNYKFYQAITAHTQNTDYVFAVDEGVLLEQDLYMSLLYAAAHNVAGYAWFCYFPISGETSGSMVGFDGNGYGNGIGNGALKNDDDTGYSYYNAAKTAGYQFELIQGLLDGYEWKSRSVSGNKLTTTLSNGTNTATFYVNADVTQMKNKVTFDEITGNEFYLVGYGVGTPEAPYEVKTNVTSITLYPGQALIVIS